MSARANDLFVRNEAKLAQVEGESDAEDFLLTVRIGDFARQLLTSKAVPAADPHISGCFDGEVTRQDHRIWQMSTEVFFNSVSGAPTGRSKIVLSENGKPFSSTSGSGDMKDFRKFANDSKALLLAAGPSHYFQLYYLESKDAYFGNLYQKVENDRFPYRGIVWLNRRKGTCTP